MLLWVITLVIIPLALVSLVNYYQAQKIITDQIYVTFDVLIDSLRTQMVIMIESLKSRVRDFTSDRALITLLSDVRSHPDRGQAVADLNKHVLRDKALAKADIYDILVFNGTGALIASSYGEPGALKPDPRYFDHGRKELTVLSDWAPEGKALLSISAPVIDIARGDFMGVITVRFRLSGFDTLPENQTAKALGLYGDAEHPEVRARLFIADASKKIAAASSESLVGTSVAIDPVERAFGEGKERTGEFIGIYGQERLGASVIVHEPRWVLVISISKNQVFRDVRSFMVLALLRIGGGLILVIVLSVLISKRIAQPVLDIAAAAERISHDHWDERVAVKDKKGEIVQLAHAFNDMVEKLQASFRSLDHNRLLSEKIFETNPSGLAVLDGTRHVRLANKRFFDLLETGPEATLNRQLDDALRVPGATEELARRLAKSPGGISIDWFVRRPGHSNKTLKLTAAAVPDGEEVILVIEEVASDPPDRARDVPGSSGGQCATTSGKC
jgi:HAMP domain-containing protein